MVKALLFKQKGIALISVLLVFLILAWVSSYFIGVSQKQLSLMQLIKDRVVAEIEADSSIDEVYFAHLSGSYKESEKLSQWNYRGIEFPYNENIELKIQDTQGKLTLDSLDKGILKNLLLQHGVEDAQTARFLDCLADWEDSDSLKRMNGGESDYYQSINSIGPRDGRIQSVSELASICGFPSDAANIIFDNILLRGERSFSPAFSSRELIQASNILEDRKELLIQLRQQKNAEKIDDIFNQDSHQIGAYQYRVSSTIELSLRYKKGAAVARRNVVISHRLGYKPRPIIQYWHWSE